MRFNFKHKKRMTQTSIKVDASLQGRPDPAGKSNLHSASRSRGNGARKRVRLMVDDEESKKSVEVAVHASDS